jgi:hypothetical protein
MKMSGMMRTFLPSLCALMMCGLASADDHGGKVSWIRDPYFGLAKAKVEGRATMIFFTADW